MDWLISLLDLFGVTPDKYPFLVLGVLMIIGVIYIRLSIGKKLGKIKDNVLVVITHLSSTASSRGRLNTDLIAGIFIRDEYLKDHPEITQ